MRGRLRLLSSWAQGLGATRLPLLLLLLLLGLLAGAAQGACPDPPSMRYAMLKEEFRVLRGFRVGLVIQYVCRHTEPDYVVINITCTEKSQWSKPDRYCIETVCAYPGPLRNGSIQVQQEKYNVGSKITYSCDLGFRLVGESASECIYLKGVSKWNNSLPSCNPVECRYMAVNSGIRIKGTGEPNVYGKIIGYECLKSGYVLIGSATSRCDETGNWNPGSPFCVKKAACEYPGPLTNGIVQEEQKEYKIDSEVTYYCNPGFTLVGERTSKCVFQEKKMKWSTSLPSCESGKCKNPEVRHGIRLTGLDSFHAYGQTVTYECKIGYYMVGSYISRCEENGTWYPKIPTCEKISPEVCGAPFIVNGTVQMLLSTYVIGMGITIICNEDNSFLDDTTEMTTECLGYNVWDPPVKPCLSTTSPDISPLTIYNGAIIEGKKRHYRPGDSVVVSCNAGYTLIGPSTIRYIGGKKWTPYMPTCSLNFLLVMLIIVFLLMLCWLLIDWGYRKYFTQNKNENVETLTEVTSKPTEVISDQNKNEEPIIEDLSDWE